ncbi:MULTISPECIES: lipid asymmetry maintenance protein MlaB [Gammaproteobacteria]|uniref:STAS domain-containing protein n=1 Tax=Gammaproteobacteria TaxID=1236 RepID=UPI000DCFB65A|nr:MULTISPECIES: STAS domain-containing protein [Gammaproteobacteria]RTE86343.1 STAS domain-containing protein [Aliidiomarina sp. B3213]TCZ91693.1 STAS domain-containing protein [Lysobacter sp. N42]
MSELQVHSLSAGVKFQGTLNRNTVPKVWRERKTWMTTDKTFTADLENIDSVDSAGLAMLIQLKSELEQNKQELTLQGANEQLKAFAEMSGVTELLGLND